MVFFIKKKILETLALRFCETHFITVDILYIFVLLCFVCFFPFYR